MTLRRPAPHARRQRREPIGPWGHYVKDVLLRQGLSYRAAYEAVNAAARADGEKSVNYGRQSIGSWIGGVIPRPDTLRWIATAWNEPIETVSTRSDAHRRWRDEQGVGAADSHPAPGGPEAPAITLAPNFATAGADDDMERRRSLKTNHVDSADDPSADAIELSRLVNGSDIGPCAIPSLEQAVLRLRRSYSKTPPPELEVALRDRLRFVRHLLRRPLRPSNRSDVLAAAGWLTLLLSTVYSDLQQRELAHTYRDLALHLGDELGHTELQAWAWETSAWFSLLDQRYRDAIRYAQAAQAVAPPTSVKVAVNLQEARAWARLGAQSDAMDAMRRAQTALEPLSYPDHPDDHYTFDPAKVDFYTATCYVWLGKSRLAERHAREVIAAFSDPTGPTYWPTRVATTRIDLALALTQLGELDEAGHQGFQAFDTPFVRRTTLERAAELDASLRGHHDVSLARDFHERYHDLLRRR